MNPLALQWKFKIGRLKKIGKENKIAENPHTQVLKTTNDGKAKQDKLHNKHLSNKYQIPNILQSIISFFTCKNRNKEKLAN